jgi:hypothetical protein
LNHKSDKIAWIYLAKNPIDPIGLIIPIGLISPISPDFRSLTVKRFHKAIALGHPHDQFAPPPALGYDGDLFDPLILFL